MDEAKAIADLSRSVALLSKGLSVALAENKLLKQQLGSLAGDVRRHDRRAENTAETALNIGGPGG